MTHTHPDAPDPDDRAAANAAFFSGASAYTGFWDDQGRPAPWPDNFDEWRPTNNQPVTRQPGQQPF